MSEKKAPTKLPVVALVGFEGLKKKINDAFGQRARFVWIKRLTTEHPTQKTMDQDAALLHEAQVGLLDNGVIACWRHCWALAALPSGCARLVCYGSWETVQAKLNEIVQVLEVPLPEKHKAKVTKEKVAKVAKARKAVTKKPAAKRKLQKV